MTRIKKRTACIEMAIVILLLVSIVRTVDVRAALNPSDIVVSEEQKIESFRTQIETALASEVFTKKCLKGRYFLPVDFTDFSSFANNVTAIELEKISEEIARIPEDKLKKYLEMGIVSDDGEIKKLKHERNIRDFISIIIWNFDDETLEICNISEITSLSEKEFKNYAIFCRQICEKARNDYAKEMYQIEYDEDMCEKDIAEQERVYEEIEDTKNQNPEKEEILRNLFGESEDMDYYIMKQKVLDTQDVELLEFFESTEGKWTAYLNSENVKRLRDCYRIYTNEQQTLNRKILQNPRYIPDLINQWDGKQSIEEFIANSK